MVVPNSSVPFLPDADLRNRALIKWIWIYFQVTRKDQARPDPDPMPENNSFKIIDE